MKGLRSFCNGVSSASTLNQNKAEFDSSCMVTPSAVRSAFLEGYNFGDSPPTQEEMILQLELEEETSKKAKLDGFDPQFSVDGHDAMYRSSFQNLAPFARVGYKGGRNSVCCSSHIRFREKPFHDGFDLDLKRTLGLPQTITGESVLWCQPSVVAKLMGLDAMPVLIGSNRRKENPKDRLNMSSSIGRENLRRAERQELEK
ncbi:hypothetical protein NE237_009091 [Protea cynaroides]|uniref:DUF3741 domain-containing protein n=1 Tax=Protea cynaroides TaxID=273540 RepID=A0A9Q0KX48_9MAGN|nr:hypothetical protein NE237_009091 [Protea cynaroides]